MPDIDLPPLDEQYQKEFRQLSESNCSGHAFYEHSLRMELECRERQLLQALETISKAR